jgi:hypothetical protein
VAWLFLVSWLDKTARFLKEIWIWSAGRVVVLGEQVVLVVAELE